MTARMLNWVLLGLSVFCVASWVFAWGCLTDLRADVDAYGARRVAQMAIHGE